MIFTENYLEICWVTINFRGIAMLSVVSSDKLLTPKEAADRLGTTPSTLNIWRCTGRYNLPFVKIGARVKYRASDVERFIERRTRSTYTGPEAA